MPGCSCSHLCVWCRCQCLSWPVPITLNRNFINAVSAAWMRFIWPKADICSGMRGIIIWTLLAISASCFFTCKRSPAWLAQMCTYIAHSHGFSGEFPPQVTRGNWKPYPENYSCAKKSYSYFPSNRFKAMIKSMPQTSAESKEHKHTLCDPEDLGLWCKNKLLYGQK